MTDSRTSDPPPFEWCCPSCSATGSSSRSAPLSIAGGLLGATVADLFMPVFSGHLVDAMTSGGSDPAASHAAIAAFAPS